MAYSFTAPNFGGSTGTFGIEILPNLTFSDIFDGVSSYYHGSTIQVQEVLEVRTEITKPQLVDIDMRWFLSHKYIGTIQVGTDILNLTHNEGDDVFLVDTRQQLKRYSTYTIVGNQAYNPDIGELLEISDCNFFITTTGITVPGNQGITQGMSLLGNSPVFKGRTSRSIPLLDLTSTFYPKMSAFGFYLNPGVTALNLKYDVAIINSVQTFGASFPIPVCEFPVLPDCNAQFANFTNGFGANEYRCATLAIAETRRNQFQAADSNPSHRYSIGQATYTCPTDSSQTFTYYIVGRNF